ncbi:hypothetical protein J8273_5452 [Carpediemonas membranifera]|uniref:Uncharacterized protein n=1 Tax=Carpediemonas membranifera TaxID=201153 RepID=A0A8J6AV97_9EUKA|nr:hypothetical protein J8273_5452 [Carpediemonas membranifera]|eukprot:KAG9392460.1 hypothetical protein J8273_5452 [Carpediemonas membranifera]
MLFRRKTIVPEEVKNPRYRHLPSTHADGTNDMMTKWVGRFFLSMEERRRAVIGRYPMFDRPHTITFVEALTPYLGASFLFGTVVGGSFGATVAASNSRLYPNWRTRVDASFLAFLRYGFKTGLYCVAAAPVVLGSTALVTKLIPTEGEEAGTKEP